MTVKFGSFEAGSISPIGWRSISSQLTSQEREYGLTPPKAVTICRDLKFSLRIVVHCILGNRKLFLVVDLFFG